MSQVKAKQAVEDNSVQLLDAPLKPKKFALRLSDRVDNAISVALNNEPPAEGEHIYASPRVPTFHDANGESKRFDEVIAVSVDGRPSTIGGWLRTSDEADIARLDGVYCAQFSGDFRKVYPV